MIDPLIAWVIAIGFAVLFGASAIHKLTAFAVFRATLGEYRLLPEAWVTAGATATVALEGGSAVAWLLGGWTLAACSTIALLSVYMLAIGVNLARGRIYISCGCGGNADQPISMALVVRNGFLVLAAVVTLLPINERALAWFDYASIGLFAIAGVGLYATFSVLLTNRAVSLAWLETQALEVPAND